ncbi:hypothetical protein FAGKG844_10319 [Frankia sp. AgKG'84/4]
MVTASTDTDIRGDNHRRVRQSGDKCFQDPGHGLGSALAMPATIEYTIDTDSSSGRLAARARGATNGYAV